MGVLTSIRMVRLRWSSIGFLFLLRFLLCFCFFAGSFRVAEGRGRDFWHPSPRPPFVGRVRAKTLAFAGVFGSTDDPYIYIYIYIFWFRYKYFLLFVDHYSLWMWVYMLKEKGETLCAFKKFKRLVENGSYHKLKTVRTNRGGEFLSQYY